MWEQPVSVLWSLLSILTLMLSILFLARTLKNKKYRGGGDEDQRAYRFPPGRRSWPVIGDSFNWYSAVASSHPPKYVEEQVKR